MSRGIYSVNQYGVTSGTSIVTLIELEPSATSTMEILRLWIENENSETSEQWACSFVTKSADGTNVTSPTVVAHDLATAAYGGAVRGMCTTLGTIDNTFFRRGFNILNGFEWIATPDEVLTLAGAKTGGLHLPVAPPTSTTISCGVTFAVRG